jgi:hypothetical protein
MEQSYSRLSYSPFTPDKDRWTGYAEYQLDANTFIIGYRGYRSTTQANWRNPPGDEPLDEWIGLTQNYVLYRAAEATLNRAYSKFRILYKTDGYWFGREDGLQGLLPDLHVYAMAIIRFVTDSGLPTPLAIYEARAIVNQPPDLPGYERAKVGIQKPFARWRRPIQEPYAITPWWNGVTADLSTDSRTYIIESSPNRFRVESIAQTPIALLDECVRLAEQKGYQGFELENWIAEEEAPRYSLHGFYYGPLKNGIRATMVLVHDVSTQSGKTIFVAKDLKPNVDRDLLKKKRLAVREEAITKQLQSGLIY